MRVPDYYPQFACIADRCVNSCCRAGWEIDLDDDTYARYMTVEGELGERLKKYIDNVEEEGEIFHVCHMQEGSCPFVNKRGLCDIVLALGEDALSVVCTEYPRYYVDCGPVTEVSLSLSCEEAARLLYEKETPMTFMEIEDTPNVAGKVFDEEDEEYLMIPMDQFHEIRNNTISLLQDRSKQVSERLKNAFSYTEQVQEVLNDAEDRLEDVSAGVADSFEERLDILEGMVVLSPKWQSMVDDMKALLTDYAKYQQAYEDSLDNTEKKALLERVLEQTAVYLVFRYFPRALDDGDIQSKMRFVRFCLNTLHDMALVQVMRKKNAAGIETACPSDLATETVASADPAAETAVSADPVAETATSADPAAETIAASDSATETAVSADPALTLADFIALAGIFSVEVEHAADNVDYVLEELLFAENN